jgi:ankyrin repeat protein
MDTAIPLPRAAELNLDDIPYVEGMAITCFPPAAEHMTDPYWYDQGGRNPLVAREIFKLPAGEVRSRRLRDIVHEFKHYGAAMYEVAAEAGRADVIRLLFELGAGPNVEAAKEQDMTAADAADENYLTTPKITIDPPLTGAAIEGHLECVQVLVDEVKVWIDEPDITKGGTALVYAAAKGHVEVVRFLLSKGATVETKEGDPDLLAQALKGGNADAVKAILESEQWKAAGVEIGLDHLPFACRGGNAGLVRLVLSGDCLSAPTCNLTDLTEPRRNVFLYSVVQAISSSATACLRLLLPYATRQRPDGSYEYFRGDDSFEHVIFNVTEDAIEKADDPELFRIVWESIVCQPDAGPSDFYSPLPQADGTPCLTKDEAIHRRLISAAHNGRVETVKLIHEHYGADVNHISHKYSSTCLGRAAGAGLHDLEGRLAVVRYLLEHTDADLTIANGEFANGETPLALSLTQRQPEMVKLLLEFGGPVESIDEHLLRSVEGKKSGAMVRVRVALYSEQPRRPVKIWTRKGFKKTPDVDRATCMKLEWERDELLRLLKRLKIRSSDAELLRTDPKGRPLATAEEPENSLLSSRHD